MSWIRERLGGLHSGIKSMFRSLPVAERRPTAAPLVAVTVALVLIGLVMTLSASTVYALQTTGSAYSVFMRQALWVLGGLVALGGAAYVDHECWRRVSMPLLVISLGLLVLVLVPGFGVTVFGATRWIGLGPLRLQPSEITKVAIVLVCASVLERKHGKLDDPLHVVVPLVFPILGAVALLILLEPDLGTTLTITAMVFLMVLIAGARLRNMVQLAGVSVLCVTLLAVGASYRRTRLVAFLDPWADKSESGYQVVQSLIAIGSGGPTGVGLGASRQKWSFLPNAHTDFIYAILGEELGLVGSVVVLALITALILLCVRAARRSPTILGSLLAGGVAVWIGVQAFLNIGAVTGLLPITGVPLPLMSVGGSNAVVLLFAIGVVVSVARAGDRAFVVQARKQRKAVPRA